jgi:hypothetical protein
MAMLADMAGETATLASPHWAAVATVSAFHRAMGFDLWYQQIYTFSAHGRPSPVANQSSAESLQYFYCVWPANASLTVQHH